MAIAGYALGQPHQPVLLLAQKEKPALLETLKELTVIESGSRETEELDRIAALLAAKHFLWPVAIAVVWALWPLPSIGRSKSDPKNP